MMLCVAAMAAIGAWAATETVNGITWTYTVSGGSANLIVREERRFLRSRPSKVHHIHNMRTMIFLANHILRLEVVHPCAAAFTIPRVEVRIINGQELTLLVKHLIGRHFRVIYLDILILLEGDTI